MTPRRDRGASTVEFTLVSVLLLFLFCGILQLGFVLHTRNLWIAAAQDGARFGANADRDAGDAEARARQVVSDAMSPRVAGRLDVRARVTVEDGVRVMEVRMSGPLPVVFLPIAVADLAVEGHALEEG